MIELSPHVSFLLILPPVEDVCIIPGQSDTVIEREDLVLLPVQVFEMIHLCTYQTKFISRYSRLSSILEMDIILAQQMQREVSIAVILVFHPSLKWTSFNLKALKNIRTSKADYWVKQ